MQSRWQDDVYAIYTFHIDKQREYGGKLSGPGRPRRNETRWTVRDTARELNVSIGAVSEAVTIAIATNFFDHLLKIKDRYKVLEELDNLSLEITTLKTLAQIIEELRKEFYAEDFKKFNDPDAIDPDVVWNMIDKYLSQMGVKLVGSLKTEIQTQQ